MSGAPSLQQWQQAGLRLDPVHLVERTEDGPGKGAQRREHQVIGTVERRRVHDEADHIDLLGGALGGLLHELTELTATGVQARRVDEDHLRITAVADTRDAVAGGLRP